MEETTTLLDIVQIGDPILRMPARKLSREEILHSEMQAFIEKMKVTMRQASGVGIAAPQVGESIQVIVIEDKTEYHRFLTPQQIIERERREVPFHVLINPQIYKEGEEVEFFEACLSVPQFRGIVPRARKVRIEALNENAEPVTIQAQGWYARILQHEIDHLHGILFIDRMRSRTFMTEENYDKLWKNKSIEEILQTFEKETVSK